MQSDTGAKALHVDAYPRKFAHDIPNMSDCPVQISCEPESRARRILDFQADSHISNGARWGNKYLFEAFMLTLMLRSGHIRSTSFNLTADPCTCLDKCTVSFQFMVQI